LVEDEWERELESDEDLDLLFVTFDEKQTTVDELLETIRELGFDATVKD
jgi:hypothetical protein